MLAGFTITFLLLCFDFIRTPPDLHNEGQVRIKSLENTIALAQGQTALIDNIDDLHAALGIYRSGMPVDERHSTDKIAEWWKDSRLPDSKSIELYVGTKKGKKFHFS